MPITLIFLAAYAETMTFRSRGKRFSDQKRSIERDIIAKHDAILLVWTSKQMANFVHMCSYADVCSFPTTSGLIAVIRNVPCIRWGAIHKGRNHLLDTRRVALQCLRAKDGQLEVIACAAQCSMAGDGPHRRVPV